MSLDKAVAHGKERRKPWRKSARFDPDCRPGGTCPWCKGNREHQHNREKERSKVDVDTKFRP